ncbi:ACR3 family arsenite efflux transporter [uncultured Cetobacterium sp.]|uniref:ACR3 family arsenite efflux transporter n=2 Tax=Cetobacterium sp. TaxID=2071632 RepID=UPI0025DD9254|nr:ACR3 family arsenite efflux transporter [uncultured Cetobacterium sp.]
MGFFEKYLSVWVGICIVLGVAIGIFAPVVPETLALFEYSNVSIPVAILIWLMIYPMMLKIDFTSIMDATKNTKGLTVTCVTNWLIKPFTMYAISVLFFKVIFKSLIPLNLADEYIAGAVLLGAAPCTAMVFVWSQLTKGNPAYTLVQVAVNDLILLIGFVPIVALLLGINNVVVPYDTLILSVVLFVVIPLILGATSRHYIIKSRGLDYFRNIFIKKFDKITITGLLLTLTIIFSFQGRKIIDNPLDILLISIPLIIQTFFIFFLAYGWAKVWKLPHEIASPAGMIGASNFFELAVAVSISLFGLNSGATLATVVGVLVEVPVMLILVGISNKTREYFVKA